MLTPSEAAQTILQHVTPLPTERRALKEALDLVLAEDVRSPIDLPGWDNSAMDGYAVRASDLAGAASDRTATLTVIETVAAGRFPAKPVGPGQATRIFTGAPLPAGADSVIRQEDVELLHDGRVTVRDGRDAGKNIRRRGEDIRKGDVALAAGATLGPAQLGVLASIAHGTPLVHRPPRVAFMGSGDEIADLDEADAILAGRKIATSNTYTLFGMNHRAAGEPREHDGDVRAVRAARAAETAGPPPALPAHRAGMRGRAHHTGSPAAAFPAGRREPRRCERRAGRALDGPPGLRHPQLHG